MISKLVLLAGLTLGAESEAPYAVARENCLKSQRPLIALVGAVRWCVPCKKAHQLVPLLRLKGEYAYVDTDDDPALAESIAGSGPIPRLAVWRKVKEGWVRKVYVNAEEIEKFAKKEAE